MVITDVNQVVYNGDGSTAAWPFTFRIIDATDIKLTIIDSDGTETDVVSDYYVDVANNTVYYPGYAPGAEPPEADQPAPVQAGQKLLIYRELPITQEKNLGEKWPFNVIELGLDKLTMILQQIAGWWDRCLKISPSARATHPDFDMSFPVEAGKSFRVNAEGTAFEVSDDPGIAAAAAYEALAQAVEAKDVAVSAQEAAEAAAALVDVQAVWFDNVADMVAGNIPAGNTAGTRGYYSVNDGGSGTYAIREKDVSDVDDGGSIIFLDNGNVAELIVGDSINPIQFGAVCDGLTDDSSALQNCVNYAYNKIVTVKITKDILVNDTITVNNAVNIVADAVNAKYFKIYVGDDCTTVFDCVGVRNSFRNLLIEPVVREYKTYVGIDFHGNDSYNVDSFVINCHIGYAEKGAVVRGRNVKFTNCGFVHCKYGVYYDFPVGATQMRGCEIRDCRFHGIGEEEDLEFVNCAAVYMKSAAGTNLTIQNCIADQGGTFFEGYATSMLMTGNFVQSFAGPLINSVIPSGTSTGEWTICDNYFNGKQGSTTYGETVGYPSNMVVIENKSRLIFCNNVITYCEGAPILLDTVTKSKFSGNMFRVISRLDNTSRYAYTLTSCSDVVIDNNIYTDTDTYGGICKSADNSSASVYNNHGFPAVESGVVIRNGKRWYQLYSFMSATETTLDYTDIPNGDFLIASNDTTRCWAGTKNGTYISLAPVAQSTVMDFMSVSKPSTGLKFDIHRVTYSTGAWTTPASVQLYLYVTY